MAFTPNYQGLFLRGLGEQASTHWGNVRHTSNGLGSVQGDAIRNITGSFGNFDDTKSRWGSGALVSVFVSTNGGVGTQPNGNHYTRVDLNAANAVPTAMENRPVNTAVRYLIRAR